MVSISMDCFVKKFQPDIYDIWKAGKDFGVHPEDDQSKLNKRYTAKVVAERRTKAVEQLEQEQEQAE